MRQIDAGAPVLEVTRKLGISEATYYVWRKRYGQMAIAEIRRLRQLEGENSRLKQLVADLTLDKGFLQEVLPKRPEAHAQTCASARRHRSIRNRVWRACGLLMWNRASWYYRHHGLDDTAIRMRLRELAQARPRFG